MFLLISTDSDKKVSVSFAWLCVSDSLLKRTHCRYFIENHAAQFSTCPVFWRRHQSMRSCPSKIHNISHEESSRLLPRHRWRTSRKITSTAVQVPSRSPTVREGSESEVGGQRS